MVWGRYELKAPWHNGSTHVIFEPLDFISGLVLQVVLRPLLAYSVEKLVNEMSDFAARFSMRGLCSG